MAEANADDLALLLAAAGEAGALALSYFGGNQRTWLKEGGSIVGEADIAVDRRLSEILRTARPDYGWLSEESVDEPERLIRARTFVVDPIDGTRAFVAGRTGMDDLAGSRRGRPPGRRRSRRAVARTDVRGNERRRRHLEWRADRRLERDQPRRRPLRQLATLCPPAWPIAPVRRRPRSVTCPRSPTVSPWSPAVESTSPSPRRNAQDWDLAAADLLVHEAGGRVADLSGATLLYNRPVTTPSGDRCGDECAVCARPPIW